MKTVSRSTFAILLAAIGLYAGQVMAGAQTFTLAVFEAAQKTGKPVLIDVTAPWCPTCRAQAPILNEIAAEPRFRDLQVFTVDFDSRKDVLRKFGVRSQSTLIVFKGTSEAGRSVGDTSKASIAALLAKGL